MLFSVLIGTINEQLENIYNFFFFKIIINLVYFILQSFNSFFYAFLYLWSSLLIFISYCAYNFSFEGDVVLCS